MTIVSSNTLEFWRPRFRYSLYSNFFRVAFSPPCVSCVFLGRFMNQMAGNFAREMAQLRPRLRITALFMSRYIHPIGAIRERYMNRPKGTSLMVWFWLGRAIGACRGIWWKYQCIHSSMETSLDGEFFALRHFIHGVEDSNKGCVFLIIQKCRLTRRMSCNWFMAQSNRTKFKGETNKVTCPFCHQKKIESNGRWYSHFSVSLESKLIDNNYNALDNCCTYKRSWFLSTTTSVLNESVD